MAHLQRWMRAGRWWVAVVLSLSLGTAAQAQTRLLHYGVYSNASSERLAASDQTNVFDGFVLIDDSVGRWHQIANTSDSGLGALGDRMRTMRTALRGKLVFYVFLLGGLKDAPGCFDWGRSHSSQVAPAFLGSFAGRAKAAGLTGIGLDMEAYRDYLWSSSWAFPGEPISNGCQHARTWGRRFGDQIYSRFPECQLLIMHGGCYDVKQSVKYDLYPYFLIGLLEALYDRRAAGGQLHLLLESSYDGTLSGAVYDRTVLAVYDDVRVRARLIGAGTAASIWESPSSGIALGAWPLGSFEDSRHANAPRYTADSFGTQLNNFKSQYTTACLGQKPARPGRPRYAWVYGESEAWLRTAADTVAPYRQKVLDIWRRW